MPENAMFDKYDTLYDSQNTNFCLIFIIRLIWKNIQIGYLNCYIRIPNKLLYKKIFYNTRVRSQIVLSCFVLYVFLVAPPYTDGRFLFHPAKGSFRRYTSESSLDTIPQFFAPFLASPRKSLFLGRINLNNIVCFPSFYFFKIYMEKIRFTKIFHI